MRLLITLTFILSSLLVFGQSRKGHFYLSGNTSLSAERILPAEQTTFGQFPATIRGQFGEIEGESSWRARSSRIGYFVTNRLMVGTDLYVGTETTDGQDRGSYFLDPFVRYYVTNRPGKKVNYFAQLGFGTFGEYGFGSNYETNFHLGAGAEVRLSDDVAASALLRYNAQASGLNYTELEIQLNAFIGGGLGKSAGPALVQGSLMIDPAIGSIQLGHRGRDEILNLITDLNVRGGYFLHDHWMVEAGFSVNTNQYSSGESFGGRLENEFSELEANALIGARFFPAGSSRLRPYLLGRTNFSLNEQIRTPSFGSAAGLETRNTQSRLHLQAGAGALLSLSNHLALDAEVLYAAPVAGEAQREVRGRVGLKVFLHQ